MRRLTLFVLAGLLACGAALAQQPGSPGEGSGLGPGQPPPNARKAADPPPPAGCDPSFAGKYSGLSIRRMYDYLSDEKRGKLRVTTGRNGFQAWLAEGRRGKAE